MHRVCVSVSIEAWNLAPTAPAGAAMWPLRIVEATHFWATPHDHRYWMSLPAGEGYVNASQSAQIQAVGRRFGCHTCGNKGLTWPFVS